MKTGHTAMDLPFSLPKGSVDTVSNRKLGQAMLEGLTHSTRPIPAVQKTLLTRRNSLDERRY
jgi:hypothetical protein